MTPFAIYELEPIGLHGALEATGIHFYCCEDHAKSDDGYSGDGFSSPEPVRDYLLGTVCELCCAALPAEG